MKILATMLIAICLPISLFSWDDTPDCYKSLETSFFPRDMVMQALSMHLNAQSQWLKIANLLETRAQEIPDLIKQKAALMDPNPLDYPFQQKEALDLLYQTLYQVFKKVMNENMIYNESAIQQMFGDIRRKQDGRIKACFGEGAVPPS